MYGVKKLFCLSRHGLICECLGKGVLCGGVVFPWKRSYISVYTGSRCWGHTISVPAGSYTRTSQLLNKDPEYNEIPWEFTLDDPGMYLSVIRVVGTDPLQLECVEYITVEEGDDPVYRSLEEELHWHMEKDGICIGGCREDLETILIPAKIGGRPVVRVRLGKDSLTGYCRSLIISEGVTEASLDFGNAPGMKRLDFPASARLLSSPCDIAQTRWFHSKGAVPVYLGGYYCGTPGGGAGGETELVIAEGTVAVADGADFHCYWQRIVVPDSVRTIGRSAFADARCLEELSLPTKLEKLGESAFCFAPRLNGGGLSPGSLRAYPEDGAICAGGIRYRGMEEIVAWRDPAGLYRDRYGNAVQKMVLDNPRRCGEREKFETVTYWYLRGPKGLAEIYHDELCRVCFVWDGITMIDLPVERLTLLDKALWKEEEIIF